jgi:hypothetical protein
VTPSIFSTSGIIRERHTEQRAQLGSALVATYVKECPYNGPQDPAVVSVGVLKYAVPRKCSTCVNLHEARCRVVTNRLLRLDYGFCGIEGSKDLVDYPDGNRQIPSKCSTCKFLAKKPLYGLVCTKDPEQWGDVPRGLDY